MLLELLWEQCGVYLKVVFGLMLLSVPVSYARLWASGMWIGAAKDSGDLHVATLLVLTTVGMWLVVAALQKFFVYLLDKSVNEYFASYFPALRLSLGISSFINRDEKMGEEMAKAEDGEFDLRYIVPQVIALFSSVLTLLGGLGLLIVYQPQMAVYFVPLLFAALWLEVLSASKISLVEFECRALRAELTATQRYFRQAGPFTGMLCLGMKIPLYSHLGRVAALYYGTLRSTAAKLLVYVFLSLTLYAAAYWAAVSSLWSSLQSGASVSTISFLLFSVLSIGLTIQSMVETIGRLVQSTEKVGTLLKFQKKQGAMKAVDSGSITVDETPPGDVVVEELSFSYVPGRPVYHKLNVTIPGNQVSYLVGGNGVGKSTLFRILTGLYEIESGKVTVSGVDVRDVPKSGVLLHLPQETLSVPYTFRQCFSFVTGEKEVNEELAWRSLEMACLATDVRANCKIAPNQLDEPMAFYKGGMWELSGGNKRKLNIAMFFYAVLAGRVKVAIFDEPFTGVEPQHVRAITDSMTKLPCTVIISMHEVERIPPGAFITFVHRDEVKGKALGQEKVEQGLHDELLVLVPQYAKYCALTPSDIQKVGVELKV
jgi:ABC-type multidrug transport system fused ATPase/permease subunit